MKKILKTIATQILIVVTEKLIVEKMFNSKETKKEEKNGK